MLQRPHNSARGHIANYMLRLGALSAKNRIGMQILVTWRSYFKIFHPIVSLNAVAMVHGHSDWNRTNEGFRDQGMDAMPSLLPVHTEDSLKVPGEGVQAGLKDSQLTSLRALINSSPVRPYSSLIAHFISRKSIDRLPKFGRMLLRHLDSFQSRCLEPLATLTRCSGSFPSYHAAVL